MARALESVYYEAVGDKLALCPKLVFDERKRMITQSEVDSGYVALDGSRKDYEGFYFELQMIVGYNNPVVSLDDYFTAEHVISVLQNFGHKFEKKSGLLAR